MSSLARTAVVSLAATGVLAATSVHAQSYFCTQPIFPPDGHKLGSYRADAAGEELDIRVTYPKGFQPEAFWFDAATGEYLSRSGEQRTLKNIVMVPGKSIVAQDAVAGTDLVIDLSSHRSSPPGFEYHGTFARGRTDYLQGFCIETGVGVLPPSDFAVFE